MMSELREVQATVQPSDTLLVVDAMTGQEAAGLVKAFNEAAEITGKAFPVTFKPLTASHATLAVDLTRASLAQKMRTCWMFNSDAVGVTPYEEHYGAFSHAFRRKNFDKLKRVVDPAQALC